MGIIDDIGKPERKTFKKVISLKPSTMELLKAAAARTGERTGELIARILDLTAQQEAETQAKERKGKGKK